jgi:hypothetical protein
MSILIENAARNQDPSALRALLERIKRLRRQDRHELGERIARLIADLTPEDVPIDDVVSLIAEFIEDHRQQGNLDVAVRLATFGRANEHRAGAEIRAHLDSTLSRLKDALKTSETFRQFAAMREREANLDLREAVGGLRFLIVGGMRPEWWESVQVELGLNSRTEWIETEKESMPSMDRLTDQIRKGNPSAVIINATRIAHAVSTPLKALCKELGIPLFTIRNSKDDLLTRLREHFLPSPVGRSARPKRPSAG